MDQREFHGDGSEQLLYAPGCARTARPRLSLEFEGGAEFGAALAWDATEDTTRYYLSLGYRYDF